MWFKNFLLLGFINGELICALLEGRVKRQHKKKSSSSIELVYSPIKCVDIMRRNEKRLLHKDSLFEAYDRPTKHRKEITLVLT